MKGYIILALIITVMCPVVNMARVFVYGTLKKGQPNHSKMLDPVNGKAEFLAHARTTQPYPLVIADKENTPFLLNKTGEGKCVYGEIYHVDEKMLEFLDKFEEIPKLYNRTMIQLEVLDGDGNGEKKLNPGSIMKVFVYSKYEPKWLNKPTYESYDTNGDHGLKYIDSDAETPDPSSAKQQNTEQPIIIRDTVYNACNTDQCDPTDPIQ